MAKMTFSLVPILRATQPSSEPCSARLANLRTYPMAEGLESLETGTRSPLAFPDKSRCNVSIHTSIGLLPCYYDKDIDCGDYALEGWSHRDFVDT